LLIASSARFPEIDASVMRASESGLLALPTLVVLVYLVFAWMVRRLT
jgi:hypothetical protein